MPANSEYINSPNAPAATGPFSHVVKHGGLAFFSGQVHLDPTSGTLVSASPGEQAQQCLSNLEAIAVSAGCALADAVKVTIYVTDMSVFSEVNDVYASVFKDRKPARVTVGVAALPGGASIEMDAIIPY